MKATLAETNSSHTIEKYLGRKHIYENWNTGNKDWIGYNLMNIRKLREYFSLNLPRK